jgi:hypothetical protein
MTREQTYFLARQAELARAGGSGVLHGLIVDQGNPPGPEAVVIHSGVGITPAGGLVVITTDLTIQLSDLADEENLDERFGLSETPQQPARTRTGLYVLALRSVEFTANPVASYPADLQAPRTVQDGDIVEATAVSLIPYPNPVNNFDQALQQSAVARQLFVEDNPGEVSDSVLPIAMLSLDRNVIQWIDSRLVRRAAALETSPLRLNLPDAATQQAFLMQHDAQLQSIVASRAKTGLNANFAATDYFLALPPAGRIPFDAINTAALTQTYFPQQMNVSLCIVPADELPAIIDDSMSLPPIDLTLTAVEYANYSIDVLVPVPRANYAAMHAQFPAATLAPALPQTIVSRSPLRTPMQFIGNLRLTLPPAAASAWAAAINGQTFGFYLRRRSLPVFADFTLTSTTPIVNNGGSQSTTTTPAPATTPITTTTPAPTTSH